MNQFSHNGEWFTIWRISIHMYGESALALSILQTENNFKMKTGYSVFTLCLLQMENNFENRESEYTLSILQMENNFENGESVSTHSIHMY